MGSIYTGWAGETQLRATTMQPAASRITPPVSSRTGTDEECDAGASAAGIMPTVWGTATGGAAAAPAEAADAERSTAAAVSTRPHRNLRTMPLPSAGSTSQ